MNTRIIAVGGLGDSELSLKPWMDYARRNITQNVTFLPVEPHNGLRFKDRVAVVKKAVKKSTSAGEEVLLIGNSAGALACLVVASKLKRNKRLTGVIAVSPATPFGISPLGWPLVRVVWRYSFQMLFGRLINMRDKDYERIALNGVPPDVRAELQRAKLQISGKEANKLAGKLWPRPRLGKLRTNVIIVSGGADRWVSPKAHLELHDKLKRLTNSEVTGMSKWRGLGHLLVHSDKGDEIVQDAFEWFDNPKGIIVIDPR